MFNYNQFDTLFNKAIDKSKGYRFDNDTRIKKHDGVIEVEHRKILILRVYSDNTFEYKFGPNFGKTFMLRLNFFGPLKIFIHGNIWRVLKNIDNAFQNPVFFNGMKTTEKGDILNVDQSSPIKVI